MTERNKPLEGVIQKIRDEYEIEGYTAEDWKMTAEAIAVEYVPELQPKKKQGRPPIHLNLKLAADILILLKVACCRHKFNLSVEAAVQESGVAWGTFKPLRSKYPEYWKRFKDCVTSAHMVPTSCFT
jgi:hypothetical protein